MKKKLSFILAAMMLSLNIGVSSLAAETNPTFTDVNESTQYSEAILTLAKLGVINGYAEDNTFKPVGEITRAEFTAIITRAMNIVGVTTTSNFTDVNSHWALNNIVAATDRGITNGFEDNTFRPDEKVTYEQAVKMIVCALNYTNTAEALGGWPTGYLQQGTVLGLTKDVTGVVNSGPAPRGVVAQLVYNALDINVADMKTSIATDETFLNKYLGMEKLTGKVVGVEDDVTSECTATLAKDEMGVLNRKANETVVIDYSEVFASGSEVLPYLGQEVLVFYKLGNSGMTNSLVMIDSEVTKNTVTEVSYFNIDSYSDGVLQYYNDNDKRTKLNFKSDDITLFYNKKAVDASDVEDVLDKYLDPKSDDFLYGEVKITDSGSDKSIDMVEIMNYVPMMATKAPSSSDYKITNKIKFTAENRPDDYIETLVLNPDKNAYSFTITDVNGESIETTDVKANSILLIAASEDESVYTVKSSTKTVSGEIDYYDEDENLIKIEGKEYRITDYCINYLDKESTTKLDSGLNGTFYLDAFGAIMYATLKANSDSVKTSYIISASYNEDNDSVTIKMFIPGTGYKQFTIADKIKLDGKSAMPDEVFETLKSKKDYFDDDDELDIYGENADKTKITNACQLAMVGIDGSVIESITTVKDADIPEAGEALTTEDDTKIVRYMDLSDLTDIRYLKTDTFGKGGETLFRTDSNTIFIYVPQDRSETSDYAKKTKAYFSTSSSAKYCVEAYNVDSSKLAGIVLIYDAQAKGMNVSHNAPMNFVADGIRTEHVDDENVIKLPVLTNSTAPEAADITIADTENYGALQVGDMFQYVENSDGEASGIKVRIAYSDIKEVLGGDDYDWTGSKFIWDTDDNADDGDVFDVKTRSGSYAYASLCIYNLIEITKDGKLMVTREGFTDGGEYLADAEAEWITLNENTKFILFENGEYDPESVITVDELKGAKLDGKNCDKIAVSLVGADAAKVIAIYR